MEEKPNKLKSVILIILDGYGLAPASEGNAISLAHIPNLGNYWNNYPHGAIEACGEAVGLEKSETSGSETAHENIGAGRIVIQDSCRISKSIDDGSFFVNAALAGAIENLKKSKDASLHLMGLLSSSDSPHSKPKHLKALLELARRHGIKNVYLHLFTDGRDSPPKSAKKFLEELNEHMENIGVGKIATIGGRVYGMDRVKRWDRLLKAYDAMVLGKGETASNSFEAVDKAYEEGLSDEFILPTVIVDDKNQPVSLIKEGDSVIFFHLRSDRARQFTKLFTLEDFKEVKREKVLKNVFFVAFTDFGPDLPIRTAFPSMPIKNSLTVVLKGLKQLYISEIEKFAHVTYFFNGGFADPIAGEARIVLQSDSVLNYKDNPKMSAEEVADVIINNVKFNVYNFIAVNFANLDMVGHSGSIPATIKAAEEIDLQVGKVIKEILEKDGSAILVGDHGNAEEMLDLKTGKTSTSHSKNPVPVILINKKWEGNPIILKNAMLRDIAPTIIDLFGREKPEEMTGESLIKQLKNQTLIFGLEESDNDKNKEIKK